jgi:hypothetical protein
MSQVNLGTPSSITLDFDGSGANLMTFLTIPANATVLDGARMQDSASPATKVATIRSGYRSVGWWGHAATYNIIYETDSGSDFTTEDTILVDGESFPLLACNTIIDTGDTVFNNVRKLLVGMRGMMPYAQGEYLLQIEGSASSVFSFDTSHIIGGISVQAPRKKDKYNKVIAKFVNPNAHWKEDLAIYPPSGESPDIEAQLLAEDNGTPLIKEVTLDTVTNYYQAYDIARIILLKSRHNLRINFVSTSEALELSVGDVIDITYASFSWTAKEFRITKMGLGDGGEVSISAEEHVDADYTYEGTTIDLLQNHENRQDSENGSLCYGSLSLETAVVNSPLDTFSSSTLVTVPMDTALLQFPTGMTNDLTNDGVVIDGTAVYRVDFRVAFQADVDASSPQADRTYFVALYNATDDFRIRARSFTAGATDTSFVAEGRFLVEIDELSEGDLLVLKLGGQESDSFTGVQFDSAEFTLECVGSLPVVPCENAYDAYIRNTVQPNLWIPGCYGIGNAAPGGPGINATKLTCAFTAFNHVVRGTFTGAGKLIDGSGGHLQDFLSTVSTSDWEQYEFGLGASTFNYALGTVSITGPSSNPGGSRDLAYKLADMDTRPGHGVNWTADIRAGYVAASEPGDDSSKVSIFTFNQSPSIYDSGYVDHSTVPLNNPESDWVCSGGLELDSKLFADWDAYNGAQGWCTHFYSIVGHGGAMWYWTEQTWSNNDSYSLGFIMDYVQTRFSLSAPDEQTIYSSSESSARGIRVFYDAGTLKVTHDSTTHTIGPATGHVVLTFNDSTGDLKMYVDGVLDTTKPSVGIPSDVLEADYEAIGMQEPSLSSNWYPILNPWQHLFHVDRVLSDAEILALYNSAD